MNIIVTVTMLIAIAALVIGLGTSVTILLLLGKRQHDLPNYESVDQVTLRWAAGLTSKGMVVFYLLMGAILLTAPDYWFGPTWSYFQYLPHGGFGFGIACLSLTAVVAIGIVTKSKRLISLGLLCGGIAFYTAGWLIAFQGIAGRTGMMETPFMMYAGIDMLIKSVVARKL